MTTSRSSSINPRKFSEKIALLKQRENETNAQFECAMQISKHLEPQTSNCGIYMPLSDLAMIHDVQLNGPHVINKSLQILQHSPYMFNQRTTSMPNVKMEVSCSTERPLNLRHALEELQSMSSADSGFVDARKRLKSQLQSRIPQNQRNFDPPMVSHAYARPYLAPDAGNLSRRSTSDTAIPCSILQHQNLQNQSLLSNALNAPLTTEKVNSSFCSNLARSQSHDRGPLVAATAGSNPATNAASLPDLHMPHLTASSSSHHQQQHLNSECVSHRLAAACGGPAPRKRINTSSPSPLLIDAGLYHQQQQASPLGVSFRNTIQHQRHLCRNSLSLRSDTSPMVQPDATSSPPLMLSPSSVNSFDASRGSAAGSPMSSVGFQTSTCPSSSCPTSPLAGFIPLHQSPHNTDQQQQQHRYLLQTNTDQLQRFCLSDMVASALADYPASHVSFDDSNVDVDANEFNSVQQQSSRVPDIVLTDEMQKQPANSMLHDFCVVYSQPDVERRDSFTFASEVLAGLYCGNSAADSAAAAAGCLAVSTGVLMSDLPNLQFTESDLQLLNNPLASHGVDPDTEMALRYEQSYNAHQQHLTY